MKLRPVLVVSGLALIAALTVGLMPAGSARPDDEGESRSRIGLAISPVAVDLQGRNPALVGLGSYLVNAVGGCNDCHTHPSFAPGGDPYLGQPKMINSAQYLAGGRAFGPFVSRNITPEAPSGLPAGLTFEQFQEVLRHGTDFDNAHPQFGPLLQVMPWPVYQGMSNHDMRAIYEYLSSIPHAEPGPVGP